MVKKVVGCRPVGTTVLVEHLTDQEMLGTSLHIAGKGAKSGGNEIQQSVVIEVGPNFKQEAWGFGIGDRVLVVGTYNPVPYTEGRERGIVEPHNVRGVLIEESDPVE